MQQEAHLLANLFASFEKEKIFARVYNPLLTRKVIQKKLWRQGSKFANSQAFRIYRFRDGAWSEIILGAIMGASRRSEMRKRKRAMERGPELDLDIPTPAKPIEAELATSDHVREDEQVAQTMTAAHQPAPRAPVDERLSERFGPYANSMREDISLDDEDTSRPEHPAAKGWPWRRPAPPPREAEVALQKAANSNTSTNWRDTLSPGNVIPMPTVRGGQPEQRQSAGPQNPKAYAPAAPMASPMGARANPVAHDAMPDATSDPQPATNTDPVIALPAADDFIAPPPVPEAQGINVRITERTADFTLPATEAHIPQRLIQNIDRIDDQQLMFDLAANPENRTKTAELEQPQSEDLLAIADDRDASVVIEPDNLEPIVLEPVEDEVDTEHFVYGTDGDDPMLRVAQKFAADRTQSD
ncbi:MAG: hypothetical protein AAF709_08185 [Pseudomonadota bacterium]